jgi:uncharacterized protein (TIGR03435 family)
MLLARSVSMIARFLLFFFALAIPGAFGQMGFYGPVTTHLKAGDRAPDIAFTKVLNAPIAGSWSQSNLSGQLTVLAFFPDTTDNLQSVTAWNEVVEKFADKPVQFVWITGEKESALLPWLEEHPISGWVLLDSKGQTGNAYGMEIPANVIVGTDRKIAGFYMGIEETERLLEAVQGGRITTTLPDKATVKAFVESGKVHIDAEPQRMPRPDDHRPAFPPSYTVHVSLSQGEERGNASADDYWTLKGYTLKELVDELYSINSIRVHLPASLDTNKHYDFALVLPEQESREQMKDRMRQGLLDYFHVTSGRENRLVDVYVVSAIPNRKPPVVEARPDEGMGGFTSSGMEIENVGGSRDEMLEGMKPQNIGAIRSVSTEGTVDEFCHMLEAELDRPVVNETNLEGKFKFRVENSKESENDFLERLRDQLGLVITPTQRNVETLVFEPRSSGK